MTRKLLPAAALATAALSLPACIIVAHSDHCEYCDDEWHYHGRPRLGVELDDVDRAMASQLGVNRVDASLITGVTAGSPADKAGLCRYDVVVEVDGSNMASPAHLRRAIRLKKPGDELKLKVMRQGTAVEVTAVLD
jgi:S1-C subfamily serine protease